MATKSEPGITWRESITASVMTVVAIADEYVGDGFEGVCKCEHIIFDYKLAAKISGGISKRDDGLFCHLRKTGAAVSEPQMEAEGLSSQT